MLTLLTTQKQANTLCLTGILDCSTLNQVWSQHKHLLANIIHIDVAKLSRVDSAGLALLTYLCIEYNTQLTGVSSQLSTLIELYDLNSIMPT